MTATTASNDGHTAAGTPAQVPFVIERVFSAPPAQVFAMWTTPDQMVRWVAPPGFAMHFLRAAIQPGGGSVSCMTGMGFTMYAKAAYEEVRSPARIVYTQQFCDEHEQVVRHPLAPTWPETMRVTAVFSEEAPGRTLLQLTMEVTGDASEAEMATFVAGYGGMTMGWTAAFNQLDAVLASGE